MTLYFEWIYIYICYYKTKELIPLLSLKNSQCLLSSNPATTNTVISDSHHRWSLATTSVFFNFLALFLFLCLRLRLPLLSLFLLLDLVFLFPYWIFLYLGFSPMGMGFLICSLVSFFVVSSSFSSHMLRWWFNCNGWLWSLRCCQ